MEEEDCEEERAGGKTGEKRGISAAPSLSNPPIDTWIERLSGFIR